MTGRAPATRSPALPRDRLVDLPVEEFVIRMGVAPHEVFPLLGTADNSKLTIAPVLLLKVDAVGPIFVIVPYMIVALVPVVVAPVRPRCRRGHQGDGHDQGAGGSKSYFVELH